MYDYPHYKEHDKAKLLEFMRQHPFVTIVGSSADQRLEATQIPVLVEEREGKLFIAGHIARKSAHERAFVQNPNVLVLFTSAHSYVSGTWYSSNPQQASTWNYIAVHARGEIKFGDENALVSLLKKLSLHFENNNTASSTVYDNLPVDYREKLAKAIVGFEIEVTELDNVHKLSQNRDEKSYATIVENLEQQDGDGQYIAGKMKENAERLFGKKKES